MGQSIDVVVPVYGNFSLTRSCLEHLGQQDVAHRVIVVDDHSPDDTVERMRAEFPQITLVALQSNLGFAGACNAGIAAGDGAIVVLFNNDVTASPGLLRLLTAPFETDAALGSACPLLLKPDGRIDAYGITADVTMAGFVRGAGAPLDQLERVAAATRLLGPYGAVAAYRRRALEAVGTLDEGIHMYGEELDLALRLSANGWATTAVPDARGVHLGGATSGRGSASQRRRSGFGRGYLLRAYRVLHGRHAVRGFVTELIVSAGDAVLSRDVASVAGRRAGWRAAKGVSRSRAPIPGIDSGIGFLASLRLRLGDRAS